jgi:anthranilate synthase component 2
MMKLPLMRFLDFILRTFAFHLVHAALRKPVFLLKPSNTMLEKFRFWGVCLGHQAIGEAFGGRVIRAQKVMHGKTDNIHHTGVGVFKNLPDPSKVTRYHSLAIENATLPDCLEVTATSSDGEIMGVRHKQLAVEGVQFHPESILSEHGHALLKNFLQNK